MTNEIIDKTIAFVKQTLANTEAGHDWFHIERVYKLALHINESEKAENLTVSLAALLHDIADSKFNGGDEEIGPNKATAFLISLYVDKEVIENVAQIIKNMSFKASLGEVKYHSLEMEVVQDADRLDAIGAIGIARAFTYGGFKNRVMYDPEVTPNLNMSKEEYKASSTPTINHFYEKLLLLKDKMNTCTGKAMAQQRHQFMLNYLEQFYKEWEGLK